MNAKSVSFVFSFSSSFRLRPSPVVKGNVDNLEIKKKMTIMGFIIMIDFLVICAVSYLSLDYMATEQK